MDLLSKKYRQAEEISNLKAEIKRLKECNEELTSDNLNTIQEMDNERRRVEQFREENEQLLEQRNKVMRKNVILYTTLQEIKVICDYENEYNSIGIDDYKRMIKDIVDLIAKTEVE